MLRGDAALAIVLALVFRKVGSFLTRTKKIKFDNRLTGSFISPFTSSISSTTNEEISSFPDNYTDPSQMFDPKTPCA